MKLIITLMTTLLLFLVSAQTSQAKNVTTKSGSKVGKKSTDLSFQDYLIKGQYDYALESEVTVQQDKVLEALLKVPKDFNSRIESSFDSF